MGREPERWPGSSAGMRGQRLAPQEWVQLLESPAEAARSVAWAGSAAGPESRLRLEQKRRHPAWTPHRTPFGRRRRTKEPLRRPRPARWQLSEPVR